jgi:hypothetical protein
MLAADLDKISCETFGMGCSNEWLSIVGVLLAIALLATLIALSLQSLYDHNALFAALGQGLAVLGAVIFAIWLLRRPDGRR